MSQNIETWDNRKLWECLMDCWDKANVLFSLKDSSDDSQKALAENELEYACRLTAAHKKADDGLKWELETEKGFLEDFVCGDNSLNFNSDNIMDWFNQFLHIDFINYP